MNHLRTPSFAWAVGLVTAALAWPGCGSDEADSSAPTFRYANVDAFCTEAGNKACSGAVVGGCGLNSESPNDIGRCANAVRVHCLDGTFEAARRKNNVDGFYQPSQAEACLQAIESAHLNKSTLSAADVADINNKCDLVFSPSNAVGGPCVEKADCAPSLNAASQVDCFYQRDSAGTLAGRCAVVKPVQPGSACTELGSVCIDDGQRDLFCSNGNCIENTAGVAEPCLGLNGCGANERCLPDPNAAEGAPTTTCQPKIGLDQPCTKNEECITGICSLRLSGGQTARLCSNALQLTSADVPACAVYRDLSRLPGRPPAGPPAPKRAAFSPEKARSPAPLEPGASSSASGPTAEYQRTPRAVCAHVSGGGVKPP